MPNARFRLTRKWPRAAFTRRVYLNCVSDCALLFYRPSQLALSKRSHKEPPATEEAHTRQCAVRSDPFSSSRPGTAGDERKAMLLDQGELASWYFPSAILSRSMMYTSGGVQSFAAGSGYARKQMYFHCPLRTSDVSPQYQGALRSQVNQHSRLRGIERGWSAPFRGALMLRRQGGHLSPKDSTHQGTDLRDRNA